MTAAVIAETKVLPTFWLSLAVTPASGAAPASYTVAATGTGGGTSAGLAYQVKNGRHYIAGIRRLTSREVYSVTVTPAGGVASAAVSVTAIPETSRVGVVRQRVCEILKAAALTLGGKTLYVHRDAWGRPDLVTEVAKDVFPAIELGIPSITGSHQEDKDVSVTDAMLPLRIVVAAADLNDGSELCLAMADRVMAALNRETNLGVAWLGLFDGTEKFSGAGEMITSDDHTLVVYTFRMGFGVRYSPGSVIGDAE